MTDSNSVVLEEANEFEPVLSSHMDSVDDHCRSVGWNDFGTQLFDRRERRKPWMRRTANVAGLSQRLLGLFGVAFAERVLVDTNCDESKKPKNSRRIYEL